MAKTDAVVLGAGVVGTSIALHLVKRGLSVTLIDRRAPGEETSYGNAGLIEGHTVFPPAFPTSLAAILRVALKQAPEANYHLAALPSVAPWLFAFWRNSRPEKLIETAHVMRPLYARAVAEHEALMQEANALRYLHKQGWLKLYSSEASFAGSQRERDLAAQFGIPFAIYGQEKTREIEPSLAPLFARTLHWQSAASVTNPLAVTRAYAALFSKLGGVMLTGDARTLHRSGSHWRIDTENGALDGDQVVVALGPWFPELLEPLGIKLPLGIKRGYHRHYRAAGNAALTHPILDADHGYCLAPMEQGIRLTTGAEFAFRDAPPTPVQIERVMPRAKALFPIGEAVEQEAWMGCRPCFADSRPVIGRAPGQAGLWLAIGHAHWGLTLGPTTGRLLGEMMTGETPFTDPKPFAAERFNR